MTDPHDPIDSWLRADVDLMPAPPGTYQQVARQARRRKAVRALTSAAGVVVIIAAIATAPRLASTLLPGGGATKVNTSSNSPGPVSRRAASRTPAASARPTSPAPRSAVPALSDATSGLPAATGLRPTSVTFVGQYVGDEYAGAVIGQAGTSCAGSPCTSVAGTSTYGRSWYRVGAPDAGPPDGSEGVSQIRFLNLQDGWAYGPQLFATSDGGQTWTQATGLPHGRVIDLETVSGQAFAVVASCTGTGLDYAAGCTSFTLVSAAAGSSHWQLVPGGSGQAAVATGGLQLTAQQGYLLADGLLLTGPVAGGAWHAISGTSAGEPPCLKQGAQPGTALIAPNAGDLYLACASSPSSIAPGKPGSLTLYVTGNDGQSWQTQGAIAAQGTARSLAVAPGGTVVLATSTGIYYSADATSWHAASLGGQVPADGFTYVGMTSTLQGVAVPVDSNLRELLTTGDGGQTWQRSASP